VTIAAKEQRRRDGLRSGTGAFRRLAVRECLDLIGVLRDYRPPEPDETWLTPAASERRLLAQINAVIALGREALEQIIDLAIDPDVPHPPRVFAAVMVLGCTAGSEWAGRIGELVVRAAERNVAEASAAVEGCGLSPNSALEVVLQELCGHEQARVRAGAVRALAFRGTLPESQWRAAMRDSETEVVMAALQAPLGSYDRAACDRLLEPWYRSNSATVARFALRAGVTLRLSSARVAATEIVRNDPARADAAILLAMFGYLGDGEVIREVMAGPGVQSGILAAAALGSIELVPDLLSLLRRSDVGDGVRLSSAQAMMTVTGIPAIDVNSDDLTALWEERSLSFDSRIRYRGGEPLTPELLLRALKAPHLSRRDRQNAYLELAAMTESAVPRFSPHDFVAAQLQTLTAIERWLANRQHGTAIAPASHG
jgi:hypothetical protein